LGKDAIYARASHVSICDNRIQRAFKDGIDLDQSSGEIRGNLIIDCDDEGIDLSASAEVDVQQNTIRDRRGGRIASDQNLERLRAANILEFSESS
jgi:parallel beta-helix repeat protein